MRSDCRGLGRKMPAPNRSISKRDAPVAIISIAQQARPNVIGHRADLRAQLKTKSTVVVMMFFSKRSSIHAGMKYVSYAQSSAPFLIIQMYPTTRMPRKTSRSEEHTSELQSHSDLVCRLLLEKKKTNKKQ